MQEFNDIEIQIPQHIHQIIEPGTIADDHQDMQTGKQASLSQYKGIYQGGKGRTVQRSANSKKINQLLAAQVVYCKQRNYRQDDKSNDNDDNNDVKDKDDDNDGKQLL